MKYPLVFRVPNQGIYFLDPPGGSGSKQSPEKIHQAIDEALKSASLFNNFPGKILHGLGFRVSVSLPDLHRSLTKR